MQAETEQKSDRLMTNAQRWLDRVEEWLQPFGDRLNPILVKEARQSLKSRQFVVTFSLLLIAGWAWSLIGVISQMPDIYYAPSGLMLLGGYYFILGVPLLLIVPFTSYRSLAGEREDGTYELLSISTLTSRQIVTGKLGSSLLQMMVYYSALAPCIAFTYLLRGVDLITVGLLLAWTFCISVLLSSLGLVFAGMTRSRHWHVLVSVVLLIALVIFGFVWAIFFFETIGRGFSDLPLDDAGFWYAQLALLTAWATYLYLFIAIAASQNSFASDNRSTRIRTALFVQTACYLGWAVVGWTSFGDVEFWIVALIVGGFHWAVYGILLTGENAVLSPRVRRQLPQSFLGRMFLTWFNPGSGTGYAFAVGQMLLLCGTAYGLVLTQDLFGIPVGNGRGTNDHYELYVFALLLVSYYVIYLGATRLVIILVKHRERFGLVLPTLLHLLALLAGAALPFVYESWRNRFNVFTYSRLQSINWFWTLEEAVEGNITDLSIVIGLGIVAVLVLAANLIVIRREVEATRVAAPKRVLDDEQPAEAVTELVDPLGFSEA
jgi:ABC-type transport system involved in cytochrome c biogenesis permease component